MNKKLKKSLIQFGTGWLIMALSAYITSLILFVVACVLTWLGANGLVNCYDGKNDTDK